MPRTKRNHAHPVLILLIVGGVLLLLYVAANTWVENKIERQLAAIPAKALVVRVNLFTRSIHLRELEIFPVDSTRYSVRLKKLILEGLNLQELWTNKTLAFQNLQVDSGKISFNKLLREKPREGPPIKLSALSIEKVSFNDIVFEIMADTVKHASFVANLRATRFVTKLDSLLVFSTETFNGAFEKIIIHHGINMYRLKVKKLQFNGQEKKITIDSALLIPAYGKFEFAPKKGEQVGRISISVPKMTLHGFDFTDVRDSSFHASLLEIENFDLYSFKDKRVPFLRNYRIPLPMESLLKVRYPISVDSLIIKDSRVTLEEIPENGIESGVVVINQINAACGTITNRYKPENARNVTLKASGYLMNAGEITATFTLPLDGSLAYFAKGTVKKLPFEKLNPALENMARFRIESGQLNNLKFDFSYTDEQSIGTLEIDYEDLKITGLKRKNDDRSGFKTFLFNTVIKNTKDQSLPKLKRTGAINIERDKRRYIFNVWWKSILDGLLSAILGIENVGKRSEKAKNTIKRGR